MHYSCYLNDVKTCYDNQKTGYITGTKRRVLRVLYRKEGHIDQCSIKRMDISTIEVKNGKLVKIYTGVSLR